MRSFHVAHRMARMARTTTALVTSALLVSGCSLIGSGDEEPTTATDGTTDVGTSGTGTTSATNGNGAEVTLLTHSDFYLPDKVIADFRKETGYQLRIVPSDGVGPLANLISAQAGKPSGDVVFGIDNTFGSRVLDAGAVTSYGGELPPGAAAYALSGDEDGALVPVDNGNVCVNIDDTWFADHDVTPPQTLDDLTDPAYRDLFVVPSASSSSPGLAFLLTTIDAYGDGWQDYWQKLVDNGTEVVPGWSEAYEGEFTQGGGGGDKPIVVSYDSSPAFTVTDGGGTSTSALLDTCYQQVEYAGVLDGTEQPDGARALIDFMLSDEVQAALPESMYVFPVVDGTALPTDWAKHAVRPTDPHQVDPAEIEANRESWLLDWTDLISR